MGGGDREALTPCPPSPDRGRGNRNSSSPDHLGLDSRKYTSEVLPNIGIWEPQHAVSKGFQYGLALTIGLYLAPVVVTVQFDHEMGFGAVEVDHEPGQHVLPPEMKTGEPVGSELSPEALLFRG